MDNPQDPQQPQPAAAPIAPANEQLPGGPTPPTPEQTPPAPATKQGPKQILLTVLVLVVSTAVGRGVVELASRDRGNGSTSEQVQTLLSSEDMKEYTSAEHGFRVMMPGFPSITRDTLEVEGVKIPYTSYVREIANGTKAYMVAVAEYTGLELDEKGALEGGVNGAVQNTPGAKLISVKQTKYKGLNAIEGHYTVPQGGRTFDVYLYGIYRRDKMYMFFTIGEPKTKFDSFVRTVSFQ